MSKNETMKNLGIMGGAFNPIHSRHLMVAQCAVDQLQIDRVLFVPSGQPPHKKAGMLDKEQRFEMVAAAVADNPLFEASRLEIDREGITWTIDTLKQLAALHGPTVRLNFIVGEDNLAVLKNYDRRQEFLALCRLVVSPRATTDAALLAHWQQELPEADLVILDCPANEVSSTLIRRWIAEGKDVRYLVHDAVSVILKEKQYYAASPESSPETAPEAADSQPAIAPPAVADASAAVAAVANNVTTPAEAAAHP